MKGKKRGGEAHSAPGLGSSHCAHTTHPMQHFRAMSTHYTSCTHNTSDVALARHEHTQHIQCSTCTP